MRGLTPEEYEQLKYSVDTECIDGTRSQDTLSTQRSVRDDLVEQGRMVRAPCACHGIMASWVTRAGREALKLYPLMQALEAHS